MEQLGIIIRRPEEIIGDDREHEEIWDEMNEDQMWDGRRIFNIDEVPWTLDIKRKQIVARGERRAVSQRVLRHLNKYRKGTLTLITGVDGLALLVVIFRKAGGPQVTKRLRALQNTANSRVLWYGSESGSMTATIWKKVLRAFSNLTKKIRGCRKADGTDWKQAVALYMDNYGTHLDARTAREMARKYGMYLRPMLRNASHTMQPVDQNMGKIMKDRHKNFMVKATLDLERLHSIGSAADIPIDKFQQMCCRAAEESIEHVCVTYQSTSIHVV